MSLLPSLKLKLSGGDAGSNDLPDVAGDDHIEVAGVFVSPTVERDLSLNTLNTFLRGEIAAVETYARTLSRLGGHACCGDLGQCLASHQRRVALLRRRILDLGGVPAQTPGAWNPFPRHGESGSVPLRDDAVIAALEEGKIAASSCISTRSASWIATRGA